MAVQNKIEYSELRDLYLDASNPRLGRENTERQLSQDRVLELMKDWTLDELALSFWTAAFGPKKLSWLWRSFSTGKRGVSWWRAIDASPR